MSATTETIGQELTPTRMITDWLASAPAEVEELTHEGNGSNVGGRCDRRAAATRAIR